MLPALLNYLRGARQTRGPVLPDLMDVNRGLPTLTSSPCIHNEGCTTCADGCVSDAISLSTEDTAMVTLDLGKCLACGHCTHACPTGTIAASRITRTAVRQRSNLVLTAGVTSPPAATNMREMFRNSLVVRYVSTGDNATDMEVNACMNPLFDASRFGIQFTASPRFADALLIGGPVPLAMHEPLRATFEAMAHPRLVIAAGMQAVSGGLFTGGYTKADGVGKVLQPDIWIPGNPPHPWMIIHGLLLAMGHPLAFANQLDP